MQSRRCKKEFPGRRLQEEGGPGELELSYAHCQEIHWQRRECDSLKHSQLKLEGCTKKEKKKGGWCYYAKSYRRWRLSGSTDCIPGSSKGV